MITLYKKQQTKFIQNSEFVYKLNSQSMKTRNNSSKAFHNNQVNTSKIKSFSRLVDKITSKVESLQDQKTSISAFKQIIERCYNDRKSQLQLCQTIKIPFVSGPVALNSLPNSFFNHQYLSCEDVQSNVLNQINYLFQFIRKTKQYYYCWIIYYNEQLRILTVKMMKKYQLRENVELLNSKYCMIGIFVNRQVNLSSKNQQKLSFLKMTQDQQIARDQQLAQEQPAKQSAYSCYVSNNINPISNKVKGKLKRAVDKVSNSESMYSLKSIKSASQTNSSSFKNQRTSKQCQQQLSHKKQEEGSQNKQKRRNFKKKKPNRQLFAEIKVVKSISNKLQASNNPLKFIRSLQKKQHPSKAQILRNFRSQQKLQLFRSISNTQKRGKDLKSRTLLHPNKVQPTGTATGQAEAQQQKLQPKHRRRLSKKTKTYSSCVSLNLTAQSNLKFMSKKPDQKFGQNFYKDKICPSFKKKKINPMGFQSSSKNSFEFHSG